MSDTASFLWEHINGKNSEQDLTEMLCGEYNIDIETAKKDVSELVATLKEFQLLEKC